VPEHLVIDADGHVMEPFWMWREYLDPGYRDLAYQVVEVDGEPRLAMGDFVIEMDVAPGDFATPGGLRRDQARGRGWDDIHPGASEPRARLSLMDEMGIDVSVLYPTFALTAQNLPDGLRESIVDAYERWMADFCATEPRRLKWVAFVPRNDVAGGAVIAQRAFDRGACGAFVSSAPAPDGRLVGDPAEDAIYATIAETGRAMGVHVSDTWTSTHDFQRLTPTRWMWDVLSGPSEIMLAMVHVFGNGLLDRLPRLRVGFLEGNLGWFPWLVHKMEESYENFGSMFSPPEQLPLEQFRERCWISGETEEHEVSEVAELVGADHVLWASDFPHYESSWTPVEELTDRPDISAAEARAMLCDSSIAYYGLGADELPSTPSGVVR
jgi:predicted TIM-barrel fold metal-dependent hydrolase